MTDDVHTHDPPAPCIRHCCLNDDDVCLGCYRSLQEILAWHSADGREKRTILKRCTERKSQHKSTL